MSGVGFLYSGGLCFLFIVEVSPSRWGWTIGLHRCSGAWNWISSLWSAMECPVMSFAMGLCVRSDFGQPCMLTLRAMFLHCRRICMVCLALELIASWVVVGFSVGMEAFGRSLIT